MGDDGLVEWVMEFGARGLERHHRVGVVEAGLIEVSEQMMAREVSR